MPSLDDTIAAWASPPARAPRALLRISGPGVPDLARALLRPAPVSRRAAPSTFDLGGRALPVLGAYYPGPRSYTGEDVLELLLPGNPRLVERVLDRLCEFPGVRRAGPGEYTARAYLHGKLTLDQAEGVAASIAAVTREELDAARSLRDGHEGNAARAWRDELVAVLALVEAAIDFTDQEDVRPISPEALRARVTTVRDAICSRVGTSAGVAIREGDPLVVIAGSPNAGKSTLFNALLARTRAVASPTPGTTRDVLVEPLDLARLAPGAGRIFLADLAGLDADALGVDALAQHAARETIAAADLVLWCDPTGRFDPAATPPTDAPILRLRTFADQREAEPSASPLSVRSPLSAVRSASRAGPVHAAADPPLDISALDHRGLPALARAIARALCGVRAAPLLSLLPRHRAALRDAAVALDRTLALARERPDSAEELADELRAALDALGELTGRLTPDDVLAHVFASFCVGK